MDNKNIVTIKDFNLSLFSNLLNQSLTVTSELMLEFNGGLLKSCSFSQTKSLIKLWTIPYDKLIYRKPTEENILEDPNQIVAFKEETPVEVLEIPTFNFYILRGDNFRNYISVFGGNSVNVTFKLIDTASNKKQATSLIISGKSTNGTELTIEFTLTTEELITNVISDYGEILKACTPEDDFKEFILTDKQINEIRGLIKKLSKADVENTAYLSFSINKEAINIKDKVFNLNYPNKNVSLDNFEFNFNILKTDFLLIGDHNFCIYTNNETQKVIFGAKYGNSIIWCMSTKVGDYTNTESNFIGNDDILDSLSMSEYDDI